MFYPQHSSKLADNGSKQCQSLGHSGMALRLFWAGLDHYLSPMAMLIIDKMGCELLLEARVGQLRDWKGLVSLFSNVKRGCAIRGATGASR